MPAGVLQIDTMENRELTKAWKSMHIKIISFLVQMLHEFHQILTSELQEREQRTSAMEMQVEKEKVTMKKEIEQLA